jgi:hypothetical protein
VVVDGKDHDLLLRRFEALLALPEGALVAKPAARRNASLTWGEVELLRRVNTVFQERKLPDALYAAAIRSGMLPRLARARADLASAEPIRTPRWALDRAAEIGAAAATAIEALGIRVLGDLSVLGEAPGPVLDDQAPEPVLDASTVTQAIVGILAATRADRPSPEHPGQPAPRRWRRPRPISPIPEF